MTITVKNLSKTYYDGSRKLKIIDDLSVTFPADQTVAIVGHSGVGKTTLLQMLGGLDRPDSGDIMFSLEEETRITTLKSDALSRFRGSRIGFIFQFHQLLPEFSALENVAMPLTIAGYDETEAKKQASALLDRVGLSDRLRHRPGMLSGGEQQRVAIARALVSRPGVVLADEPTGNLDEQTGKVVQDLMIEVTRELGALLLVVTHNNHLAEAMDLIYEMHSGGALQPLQGNRGSKTGSK